jgi:uncharacterized protein (TIGR02145 family)
MKANINSSERTYLCKASVTLIACFLFLIFPSCQKDEFERGPMPDMPSLSCSALPISRQATLYYGPETFKVASKAPVKEIRTLSNPNFDSFDGNFVLKVQNGSNNKTKVEKIEIRIDDILILRSSDYRKRGKNIISKPITLSANSTLEIKMKGDKRSFIVLWIEGTLKEEMKVTDVEGNVYKTVTIGTQVWMAENLKTTKYNDGTAIPMAVGVLPSTAAYFYYDNDISNKDIYGALYNWYAVNTAKLCPTGWHVPNNAEWQILTDYLGGFYVAGGKMKEEGFSHWLAPNTGATNESGFTALPGGWAIHSYMGESAYFSSSSEYETNNSWSYYLNLFYNSSAGGIGGATFKEYGYSVRCLKNN